MQIEIIDPKSIVTIQQAIFPPTKCIKDGGDCGAGGYCDECVLGIEEQE